MPLMSAEKAALATAMSAAGEEGVTVLAVASVNVNV